MNKLILATACLLGLANAQISTTPILGSLSWVDLTAGISSYFDISYMYVVDVSYLTNLNVGTGSPNNPAAPDLYNNVYQIELMAGI